MLNHYLETFQSFETEDPAEYISVQKNITAELRRKNRIENFEKEKKSNEEKKAQRDKEQNSRVIKKIGKPAMKKIWAKAPMKQVEKKTTYEQVDLDLITYGLKSLVDLKDAEKRANAN